jgi:hypothetical protein
MPKIKIDLHKARSEYSEQIEYALEESNKLWHNLIRLIITLSSSFLLLTLALADKLFPKIYQSIEFSTYLTISWVFLFFAIISGIVAEIDNAIFFGNQGSDKGKALREIDKKIAKGLQEDVIEIPEAYIINAPITWGVISINSFIFAIYCMCLSFLEKIFSLPNKAVLFPAGILFLASMSFYLIRKRKY